MAANQIQVKWADHDGENYEATVQALLEFAPRPGLTLSIRLNGKGTMPESALNRIVSIALEHGFKTVTTLTATWPDDDAPTNLRIAPRTLPLFAEEDFQDRDSIETKWNEMDATDSVIEGDDCEHKLTTRAQSGVVYCLTCGLEQQKKDDDSMGAEESGGGSSNDTA